MRVFRFPGAVARARRAAVQQENEHENELVENEMAADRRRGRKPARERTGAARLRARLRRRLQRLVRRDPRGLRADRVLREVIWMARNSRTGQPFRGTTPKPLGVLPRTLSEYDPKPFRSPTPKEAGVEPTFRPESNSETAMGATPPGTAPEARRNNAI